MAKHIELHSEFALNLALAVVASSTSPLVLLDGELAVIAVSGSFCRAFGIDASLACGRKLADLGAGEWNVRQLTALLRATAAGHAQIEAYEMDLRRTGFEDRRLVVNAQKLDYADEENVRLLLAVADVTDARTAEKLKDDLLREKAVLMQELQHRVANSLQIIASVLLQSARRVQSDEIRSHLHEAHQRVMSVAALQRQLSVSRVDQVSLREYFTELCHTLGASMIRDHNRLALEVDADETVASANTSVSLGLMVTELVINALKHAFPGDRSGMIVVRYRSSGADWILSVDDNGIGMPKDPSKIPTGLGGSIVQALARQLSASVVTTDKAPGTSVSISHKHAEAVLAA